MNLRNVVRGTTLAALAGAVGRAAIATGPGRAADVELFRATNAGHGRQADRLFAGVTELGSIYASAAAAAMLAIGGRRRAAAGALGSAAATWALLQAVKRIVDRPRPSDADPHGTRLLIARPMATSWPSSHPAVLTAFTRVAVRELGVGSIGRAALSALDVTVAASRVYLGVHYPSDVVSGLLLGRGVAWWWPSGRRAESPADRR